MIAPQQAYEHLLSIGAGFRFEGEVCRIRGGLAAVEYVFRTLTQSERAGLFAYAKGKVLS